MEQKQSTISDIIDTERSLVVKAPKRYGVFYDHAYCTTIELSNFLKSADVTQEVFIRFLSQMKKHHTLALFSTVRLHKVQAMMNLRQVLEAASCAAYAIRNPDPSNFVSMDKGGLLQTPQNLTAQRYKWLASNFPEGSEAIKQIKALINETVAHSNYINTSHNFTLTDGASWASAPFFDVEDEHLIKTDLWLVANVAIGVMGLIYDVAKGQEGILVADGFVTQHSHFAVQNSKLREKLMATHRYQSAMDLKNSVADERH